MRGPDASSSSVAANSRGSFALGRGPQRVPFVQVEDGPHEAVDVPAPRQHAGERSQDADLAGGVARDEDAQHLSLREVVPLGRRQDGEVALQPLRRLEDERVRRAWLERIGQPRGQRARGRLTRERDEGRQGRNYSGTKRGLPRPVDFLVGTSCVTRTSTAITGCGRGRLAGNSMSVGVCASTASACARVGRPGASCRIPASQVLSTNSKASTGRGRRPSCAPPAIQTFTR